MRASPWRLLFIHEFDDFDDLLSRSSVDAVFLIHEFDEFDELLSRFSVDTSFLYPRI